MNEAELQNAIRHALAARQPCRARVIVAYLLNRLGYNVDRQAVNQQLYGAMRHDVRQLDDHKWTLRKAQQRRRTGDNSERSPLSEESLSDAEQDVESEAGSGDPPRGVQPPEGHSAPSCTLSRASRLRMLMRLRAGLPPTDGLEHLSIGYDRPLAAINKLLDEGRWIVAAGDYGAGKTHFLQVLRSVSHSRGFATCYLCSDSQLNALNHPQRFLPNLLQTLDLPGGMAPGYGALISELTASASGRRLLQETVSRYAVGTRMPFGDALWRLECLERFHRNTSDPLVPAAPQWSRAIANDLMGITAAHRTAAPAYREATYRLLLIARDLVMANGCRGLVLLIDEAESIFTKLHNIRSRAGAVRVLSFLCASSKLRHCRAAVAMTPDAIAALKDEVDVYPSYDCVRAYEPLSALRTMVKRDDHPIVDCSKLDRDSVPALLDKIRDIYLETYSDSGVTELDGEWRGLFQARNRQLPIRLVVRQAVNLLDKARYGVV